MTTPASAGPIAAPLISVPPTAHPAELEPDAGRLRGVVAELAAGPYGGRRVGTPGGRAAAGWLAGQLEALGGRVSTEEFPVAGVRELAATPTAVWIDPAGRRHVLRHRRDMVEVLTSADTPAARTGPLVPAAAQQWRGCWVLAEILTAQVRERIADQQPTERPAGLVVARGVDDGGWMPKMITGPAALPVPVLGIRADLHRQMVATGGELAASVPLRTVRATGTNVHAVVVPSPPGGVSVLLTSHYDGVGDDPGQRLPAAADNASGVAVVLEAARLLAAAPPPGAVPGPGVAVALLDGEEAGAVGSAHHAPAVPAGTQVLNVDGAARLERAAAVEAGGPAEALLAALDRAGRQVGVALRAGAMASDNRRYAAAGLPAIGIGMGMPGYQTPAETPDRVETATLLAATRLVVATVHQLAAAPR
jgi:aminopeptidase YwaD